MAYAFKVKGEKIKLKDFDPSHHEGLTEEEGRSELKKLGEKMADLQDLLYAAGKHSLLIILQGMDTSGKDGAIRNILSFCSMQSCRVAPFKVPTPAELGHDFLWRVHAQAPGKSEMVIFNRSHYEDVLVVRVHDLVPKDRWKARYKQINAFEELLASSGTIILKFFLHISKDEQKERLLAREQNPEKSFKLSVGDWKERELWDDYQEAYEDVLEKCASKDLPWRIIPANHKWFRDLAILEAIVDELKPYESEWKESLKELGEKEKAALQAFRAEKS